jgi:hypothetical protein
MAGYFVLSTSAINSLMGIATISAPPSIVMPAGEHFIARGAPLI